MANMKAAERSQPVTAEVEQPQVVEVKAPVVPERVMKTYYVSTEGLDVSYGPVRGDGVMNHMRDVISFQRGMYQTDDPEKQAFLDKYPGCISEEAWQQTHIPAKEREEMEKRKNSRLQEENNRLRAMLAQQGKG